MVKILGDSFPTMVEHRGGKRTLFVKGGGYNEELSLVKTKTYAQALAKQHRSIGLKARVQKVNGGYYVWLEYKSPREVGARILRRVK